MDGLMMDYQLNVPAILRRADELYGDSEIVSRLPDKSWRRYSYADFVSRTKRLIVALRKLGLEDGDRVGTFMWNHSQHLEAYIGAPAGGFVTANRNLSLNNLGTLPLLLRETGRLGPPAFESGPVYPMSGAVTNSANPPA